MEESMPPRKENKTPGKNLLGNIRERLSIVEDRLDEIASLLEYEFLSKDDPERLAVVEERLEHRLREEKRREELEKIQYEKEEKERIEEAAADLLIAQEEERKRILAEEELRRNPPPPVSPYKPGTIEHANWKRKTFGQKKQKKALR
jgi:hypothetical protein